ncbi:MAG: matrixin family metalloprotease [Planctomycetales bacterium]|nr:matrixin family metalloprotease [Planctomycetales bacterium]
MQNIGCLNCVLAVIAFCGWQSLAKADYVTFGSKWGDPTLGTPSDTITWTFMGDGTVLDSTNNTFLPAGLNSLTSGISGLRTSFDSLNGGTGAFDAAIQRAFNTWSQAAAVTFQFVASDTGAPAAVNSNLLSSQVDIRIGAFQFAGTPFAGSGAVGYGPPGNDLSTTFRDALAGDIYINLDSAFFIAPGVEDDIFYTGGAYTNDLEGLMLHELGHAAIGLGHPASGPGDVMYVDGGLTNCCNFVNRQLSADDIAGARVVYGVPEPGAGWLAMGVIVCVFARMRRTPKTVKLAYAYVR